MIETDASAGAVGEGIVGVQREGWKDAKNVSELAGLLAAPSPRRSEGTHEAQGVLIVAGPGTGKTWSTQQLAFELAKHASRSEQALPLVPLLVRVQRMIARQRELTTSSPSTLLREYIEATFDGEKRDFLMQAYDLSALVVILDGADEAAELRGSIETLVLEELSSMRVVVSSRPQDMNGVDTSKFSHFVIMLLKPLSTEQQHEAIAHQLKDAEQFRHLTAFGVIRKEHDEVYETKAFPNEEDRGRIERLEQRNRFLLPDGKKRDPKMRQLRKDGSGFVRVSTAPTPQSLHLLKLHNFFTGELLNEIDARLGVLLGDGETHEQTLGLDEVRQLRISFGELQEERRSSIVESSRKSRLTSISMPGPSHLPVPKPKPNAEKKRRLSKKLVKTKALMKLMPPS